jgi:hypothetical protein
VAPAGLNRWIRAFSAPYGAAFDIEHVGLRESRQFFVASTIG